MSTNTTGDALEEVNGSSDSTLWGIPLDDLIAGLGLIMTVYLLYIAQKKLPRTQGRELKYQAIFAAVAIATVILTPHGLRSSLFSPFSVMVVGTIFPIYESIYAVCTIETTDDTLWLQYWVVQGMISFSTEWIDDFEPGAFQQRWFEFEFFFFLWLQLPWTDGATLIHDYVTGPLLAPVLEPMVKKTDGWIKKAMLTVMNASHLWILWAAFEILPASWKRTIWIALGVVFPLASSIVAIVSPEDTDDTFWLTYWSAFGVLFLVIDLLEEYLGFIPGFYSVAIFITVYLMLPMFNGAEKVFRHILVPLAGLHEMLIRKDAEVIKIGVLKNIPEGQRDRLMQSIAETFQKEVKDGKGGYDSISPVQVV